MYFGAITENTVSCKPILFQFYDQQNQSTELVPIIMTPGQTTGECGVIMNDTVAYSGIELLG